MGVAEVVQPSTRPAGAIRVLGIDPGLNITGYGVLETTGLNRITMIEAGVLRISSSRKPLEERLQELHSGVTEIIQSLRPDVLAIEQLYAHYDRPTTAILMGHARGVICLAAAQGGLAVHSYEPNKIKKLLTGSGHCPKSQVQLAVKMQLKLPTLPEPADVADALAIALCHCHLGHYHPGIPVAAT